MTWSPFQVGRLLWLVMLCTPAAANVALDTPGWVATVVLTTTALATLAWGFALARFDKVSPRTIVRSAVIGGLVLAASSAVRAVLEGPRPASVGWGVMAVLLCIALVGVLVAVGAAAGQVRRGARVPTAAEVATGVAGLALGLVIFAAVYLVAAFAVGYPTQSTAAMALAAAGGVTLAVWRPGRTMMANRRGSSRALGAGLCLSAGLTISGLVALATWAHMGPYGLTSQEVATQLSGLGSPIYLGEYAAGMRLVTISQDGGRLTLEYGRCMEGTDVGGGGADYSCTAQVEVTNESPSSWEAGDDGCTKDQPIRGIPAVISGHRLTLFTGPRAVSIIAWKSNSEGYIGDPQRALGLARWVRAYGDQSASHALPPPDAASVALVNSKCRTPSQ